MKKNSNLRLIFDESFLDVFFAILKKYDLQESNVKFAEKVKNNKELFSKIFMDMVRDFIGGSIKRTDLATSLMNKLGITKEIAEKLAKETEEKILPLIKEEAVQAKEPVTGITAQQNVPKKPVAQPINSQPKIQPIPPPPQNVNQGPDNYREPIE